MGRMIRKQVYIEPEQEELLKRRSKELGISEAALIRQAIDRLGLTSGGSHTRQTAWEEELACDQGTDASCGCLRRRVEAGRARKSMRNVSPAILVDTNVLVYVYDPRE